jgi:hypothetical protein
MTSTKCKCSATRSLSGHAHAAILTLPPLCNFRRARSRTRQDAHVCGSQMWIFPPSRPREITGLASEEVKTSAGKYSNRAMKALIPIKRLRLRHVHVRLPCLLPASPFHKQFHAAGRKSSLVPTLPPPPHSQSLGKAPENDHTIAERRFERGQRS